MAAHDGDPRSRHPIPPLPTDGPWPEGGGSSSDGAPSDDDLDLDADIPTLSPGDLRAQLRKARGRIRSLNAELAGRVHALNSLRGQLSARPDPDDPATRVGWIQLVAQRARERQTRGIAPPPRRRSLVLTLGTRLREAIHEVNDIGHRLEEVEEEAAYLRDSAAHADAWLDQLRREGRIPQYPPGEIERLHAELDAQAERIAFLEAELQKKADTVGGMLQKLEGAEDARREAAARYKGLLKQQERIAAAFQEQTRRVRALQAENEALQAKLQGMAEATPAPGAPAAADPEQAARLDQARGEAQAARDLLRATQSQLELAQGKLKATEEARAQLTRERDQALSEAHAARRASLEERRDSSGMDTRLGVAEARVLELEMELAEARATQVRLQQAHRQAEAQLQDVGAELGAARSRREEAVAQTEAAATERQRISARLAAAESLTERLSIDLQEAREQLTAEQAERPRLATRVAEAEEAATEARGRLGKVEAELATTRAALAAAHQAREAADRGHQEAEERQAQAALAQEAAEEARDRAQREHIRAEARQREAEEARDAEAQRAQLAEEALSQVREARQEAEAEAATLRDQVTRLGIQLDETEAEADERRQAAEDAEARAREAEAQLGAATEAHRQAQARLEEAQARAQDAERRAQEAEARAQGAEDQAAQASARAEDAVSRAQRAQSAAEDAEARLRGAEAHRKALEDRLAAESGARVELDALRPELAEVRARSKDLEARLGEEAAQRAQLTSELSVARATLEEQRSTLETLGAEVEEGRRRSLDLREDLRRSRQAISELAAERDTALAAASELRQGAESMAEERAQWEDRRGRMQNEIDALHDRIARLRDVPQWAPPPPAPPPIQTPAASPRRAAPTAQPPAPAGGPSWPPAAEQLPETGSLADLAPRPSPDELLPPPTLEDLPAVEPAEAEEPQWTPTSSWRTREPISIDDWEPQEVVIPDEPYAPVSLEARDERGIADPHSSWSTAGGARSTAGRRTSAGRSLRDPASLPTHHPLPRSSDRSTSRPTRGGATASQAPRSTDAAWDALVAARQFRSRGVEPEPEAAPPPRPRPAQWGAPPPPAAPAEITSPGWDRPIVDLEATAPAGRPALRPAAEPDGIYASPSADRASPLPSVSEVRAQLTSGDVDGAFPHARTLWRREPGDGDRLALFLDAARAHPSGLMEALAELDERMDPRKVSPAEAEVVSRCLIAQGLPSEAIPYVLWPLSTAESPADHPLLNEGAEALRLLRDAGDGRQRAASLLTTLNTLPLLCLGPLFFTVEGFALRRASSPGARAADFEVEPSGSAAIPVVDLAPGQIVRVRCLSAAGIHLDPELLDDFEDFNPESPGVKQRLSFAVVPQPLDSQAYREISRIRRKRRHLIVPLNRTQLVDALLDGTGPAALKSAIKTAR